MDGSTVSTPGRGWFTIDKGVNSGRQRRGARPYLVDFTPDDEAAARDPQLDKAIEVIRRR
jgi:tricorn protease